ncbi:MAG: hypothetical protein ACREQ5_15585, partial [Candidatus Dormibacteria bacterium]
ANNQIWQQDNFSVGTGILNGAVLITGEQTVNGAKIFSAITGFGPGANTEYDSGIFNAVFGAKAANVGGFELVSNRSGNISFTTAEGIADGSIEYNHLTDTFNFKVAGVTVMTVANTTVTFPAANTITFGPSGNTLLTNASIITISQGGTGKTDAANAILALLPNVAGNTGNVLTTNGTNAIWSAGGGRPYYFASPYQFFTGTSQASWTSFSANTAGVPTGAHAIILDGWADQNYHEGTSPPGFNNQFICYRINSAYGNDSNHPESNTFVILSQSVVRPPQYVTGQGSNFQGTFPLDANTSFQYIAATLSGTAWDNITLRIIGYYL